MTDSFHWNHLLEIQSELCKPIAILRLIDRSQYMLFFFLRTILNYFILILIYIILNFKYWLLVVNMD